MELASGGIQSMKLQGSFRIQGPSNMMKNCATSRSSILGEAMINLAEYADALKPFAVVLPLQGCDSGAILHVTLQLLTSKTGFREFEQQRELRERGPSTTPDHSSPDESSRCRISPSDETLSHVVKTNIRGSFKEKFRDNSLVEETVGPNDLASGLGFDVSSNTSGSLNAEKHDISSTNKIDSLKSVVSGDLSGLEWHHGWGSDYLGKNSDLGNAIEDNNKLKGFLEDMESSINEIKIEVSSLQFQSSRLFPNTYIRDWFWGSFGQRSIGAEIRVLKVKRRDGTLTSCQITHSI